MLPLLGSLLLAYVTLALQATVAQAMGVGGIRPDLPLIAVVLLASRRGAATGALAGFLIGLGQDLTNPAFLGLNALAKGCIGYGLGRLRERFDAATPVTHTIILLVAGLLHDLIYLTIWTRLTLSEMAYQTGTRTIPTLIYTVFIGFWVFVLVGWFPGRRTRHGRSSLAGR
jgi:rod shape-determining protein MreD